MDFISRKENFSVKGGKLQYFKTSLGKLLKWALYLCEYSRDPLWNGEKIGQVTLIGRKILLDAWSFVTCVFWMASSLYVKYLSVSLKILAFNSILSSFHLVLPFSFDYGLPGWNSSRPLLGVRSLCREQSASQLSRTDSDGGGGGLCSLRDPSLRVWASGLDRAGPRAKVMTGFTRLQALSESGLRPRKENWPSWGVGLHPLLPSFLWYTHWAPLGARPSWASGLQ